MLHAVHLMDQKTVWLDTVMLTNIPFKYCTQASMTFKLNLEGSGIFIYFKLAESFLNRLFYYNCNVSVISYQVILALF